MNVETQEDQDKDQEAGTTAGPGATPSSSKTDCFLLLRIPPFSGKSAGRDATRLVRDGIWEGLRRKC